ncbi:phage replisome organizer N-terminal domain-containing protein [Clostridium sp.]|uniref:phage replisome organizer N-terminal domain-containing protein n=1 Tax=Clostridium sp. TaxID=1506 RepID=UPI00290D5969|nr:phage replisome organizer N-terminal domain-containing protein [Clostridium sp.]MDU7363000.1 phage replisome organizer N-terminal domain-containing protein [Clostridium sp.]
MAEVKWIKLNTDMFDNAKIKYLRTLPEGDKIVLIWVMLLAKAGKCNANGYIFLTENIPYTQEMLAAEFDFEITTIQLALTSLMRLGMINLDESSFYVTGWDEHQNIEGLEKIREQNRIRQAKRREKQKLLSSNVTGNVTVTDSNAIDKEEERDKEREEDKDKNIKKEKKKSEFDLIIENYTNDLQLRNTIYEFIKMRKAIKAPMTSNALNLMLKKLDKLAPNDIHCDVRINILEQSIMNSWKGIFELKEGANGSTRQDTKPSENKWNQYNFE